MAKRRYPRNQMRKDGGHKESCRNKDERLRQLRSMRTACCVHAHRVADAARACVQCVKPLTACVHALAGVGGSCSRNVGGSRAQCRQGGGACAVHDVCMRSVRRARAHQSTGTSCRHMSPQWRRAAS
eukprot:6185956-Pleurochrysis_carterae.AAC.5